MRVRIHYTLPDGSEDSAELEGATVKDIREKAAMHIERRNAKNPWSEVLQD